MYFGKTTGSCFVDLFFFEILPLHLGKSANL